MIRRFLKDERGNYMLLTAAAIVPIMGALALGVDYTEISRQRQDTLNALDAANVATAYRVVQGATDAELKAYAKDFFEANLGSVKPTDAILTVVLPQNNTGGGTLKLTAQLKYKPYFYQVFADMIGKSSGSALLDFTATSEVRLKNTLEVALVMDNSGSMDYIGTGSGKKRMVLLKDAAKQLVDTIAGQAQSMKQISKPVQFSVVPFAASVNVGSGNKTATWMDQNGISPIHHENFDWSTINTATKYTELSGGVRYARGADWGALKDKPLTRFTLYDNMQRIVSATWVAKSEYVCTVYKANGSCKTYGWVDNGAYSYTYGPVASWEGCVESRPYPYNSNDTAPSTSVPATLFVPMFGPDEAGEVWKTPIVTSLTNYSANNNWWNDDTSNSGTAAVRQKNMTKYFAIAAQGATMPDAHDGPNASCTTTPITPLVDVSTTDGVNTVKTAIDTMASNGATNVPEGMAWGWRTLSSAAPFTEGRPESEKGNDKVVVVLTDGQNTYYTPSSLGYSDSAGNKSIYSNYGYTGKGYNGTSTTRLFLNTSSSVGKSDYSNDNYTEALNEQFAALCANAKAAGVMVMTVSLDLNSSDAAEKGQIDALKACSSDSRFRKDPANPSQPAKLYWNTTGANLSTTFKEIGNELSNLRIVG